MRCLDKILLTALQGSDSILAGSKLPEYPFRRIKRAVDDLTLMG